MRVLHGSGWQQRVGDHPNSAAFTFTLAGVWGKGWGQRPRGAGRASLLLQQSLAGCVLREAGWQVRLLWNVFPQQKEEFRAYAEPTVTQKGLGRPVTVSSLETAGHLTGTPAGVEGQEEEPAGVWGGGCSPEWSADPPPPGCALSGRALGPPHPAGGTRWAIKCPHPEWTEHSLSHVMSSVWPRHLLSVARWQRPSWRPPALVTRPPHP